MNKGFFIYLIHAFVFAPYFYYVGRRGNQLILDLNNGESDDITFTLMIYIAIGMFLYHFYKLMLMIYRRYG